MIFSKKLRKTAACVLTLVMVLAMSTGAFAATNTYTTEGAPLEVTAVDGYYNLTVNYVVAGGTLPEGAQVSIIALGDFEEDTPVANVVVNKNGDTATNVLWIDQYDAAQTNGSVKVTVKETEELKEAKGFWIKSGITGGNTMAAWVAIKEGTTGGEGGDDDDDDDPVIPPAETHMVLYGDVNDDGFVNAVDATLVLVYASKSGTEPFVSIKNDAELQSKVGDVNGDTFVNAVDATLVLVYASKSGTEPFVSISTGEQLISFDNNAK